MPPHLAALLADWSATAVAVVVVDGRGPLPRTVLAHGPTRAPFALASVTKLLTAMAVHVAVQEEVVSLDDAVGPEGSTLGHVLAHASGLGPDGTVLCPPATRRIYSNAGYDLAAGHVERAAEMAFGDYLGEGVTGPLGMHGTALNGSPAHAASAPADDLARLAAELLRPTLLDPVAHARMVDLAFPELAGVLPGFGSHHPNDWGLGPERRGTKHPHWTGTTNSEGTFGHFGQSGTFLWVDPAVGLALVALTDRPFGAWAAAAWPTFSDAVVSHYG